MNAVLQFVKKYITLTAHVADSICVVNTLLRRHQLLILFRWPRKLCLQQLSVKNLHETVRVGVVVNAAK